MLEAGQSLLRRSSPAETLRGLNPVTVTKEAGTSRATFYAHWSSVEDYLEELLRVTLDPALAVSTASGLSEVIRKLADASGPDDGGALIRTICELDLQWVVSDWRFRVQLLAWALADRDPKLASTLREMYDAFDNSLADIFGEVLKAWGRVLPPEISLIDITRVFSALVEGLALRHWLDPQKVPSKLYGDVVLQLVGDWALSGEPLPLPSNGDRGTTVVHSESRDRVIKEALWLFDHVDYRDAKIEHVASRAFVSASTVYALAGSKARLVCLAVGALVEPLRQEIDDHIESSNDPRGLVSRGLDDLARVFADRRKLAAAFSLSLTEVAFAGTSTDEILDPSGLAQTFAKAIQVGQRAGAIPSVPGPQPLAEALVRMTVDALARLPARIARRDAATMAEALLVRS